MKPLINVQEAAQLINQGNCIVIDARSGADAYGRYASGHLPGAQHVDLDRDLSEKKADASDGGRHPLPSPTSFAALLGKLGIQPSSQVIVYDDKSGGNAAARFWWMLKAAGHEKVQVLDGGLQAYPELTDVITSSTPITPYPFSDWQLKTASIDEVAKAAGQKDKLVIDVREAYRYNGESEPIDLVAGHIPGATNVPYLGNLDKDGKFLSASELATKYKEIIAGRQPTDVIVHCGSGVTACHTLLALEQADLPGASLYVGSWSEWSRQDRPVAKAE